MGYLFLMDEKKKEKAPPSAVDGFLGIEKRVGSWGKKERKRFGASTSGLTSAAQ